MLDYDYMNVDTLFICKTGKKTVTTDNTNGILVFSYNNASQSFHINIIPVDDELPLLVLNHIKVQEGTRKTISQFEIEALDADTKDDLIIFEITRQPRHGSLQIKKGDKYIDTKV